MKNAKSQYIDELDVSTLVQVVRFCKFQFNSMSRKEKMLLNINRQGVIEAGDYTKDFNFYKFMHKKIYNESKQNKLNFMTSALAAIVHQNTFLTGFTRNEKDLKEKELRQLLGVFYDNMDFYDNLVDAKEKKKRKI